MNASVNLFDSDCNLTHFRYPLFRITYSLVLLLGLPLNAVALWVFVHRLGLRRSVPVVYMANLALSDLLFTLSLPLRITYFTTGRWTLGDVACMIPGTMFTVNLYSSSFFIMLISVDRMLAVVYPLRSRVLRTVPVAWLACGAVWLVIGALAVPVALNHKSSADKVCNVTRCFEHYTLESWRFGFYILCGVTVVGIVVPFSIILGCTLAVVRQLRVVVSSVCPSAHHGFSNDKMVWLFVSNLLIYAVCFIPFHVVFILYGLYKLNYLPHNFFDVQTVTMCLASTNSCLDPLIYYFSSKSLQRKNSSMSRDTKDQASSPTNFSVSLRGLLQ
ncbi:lysophosphatidic acid receptor 5a [Brachyhypopomus gauderio]|uniref:lysophosphatidic acid receptor 5a n=1 Tax=Brachyhypopomus gauderio TaxID=698409 RepID=UPI0040433812